ncbi:MAG: ABC transporter ATP-binding protein [Streptosporangiaceae bacterium]
MATGDTPPRIPSRVHANEARRDPLRPATDGKILARPRQPGSSITKEHGREPGQDAQRIRPSTTGAARFRRRQVGMVFQFFNLLDDLTVADNVLLPAQLAGTRRARARAQVAELLERLGIGQYANTYPGRLSGGERQRVAIARALVNNPAVLLADEPTGAVDTATGEAIGQLLLDLNATGQTLVLVTHNPSLAARYASRVIRLADGRVTTGPAADARPGPGVRP